MTENLDHFTDFLYDEIESSQPISLPSSSNTDLEQQNLINIENNLKTRRPSKYTGECAGLRSIDEIDLKYRSVFSHQYFNLVQSKVLEDALYSDKSLVVCAPTGSGKTVIFEMAIVQLLMEIEDKNSSEDFKVIYMAPIKALCTERLTEWYAKFTKLNLLCIEVTGDTDVDFSQLKPYRIIITTPEKWDMLTRRWRDNKAMVELIKLFLIDEVHILNEPTRGPVLEAVVSRMKTVQTSMQSAHRIEQLQKLRETNGIASAIETPAPKIRFVAVSATISNPEDVADWLGTDNKPAVYHKFGDECRPVKLKRVVEGYPCPEGTSIFKFDIILNYKLWPIIQKYHDGKPTLIFCNTRKSVLLTAETLSREITINFSPEQRAKLVAVASIIKNKKVQSLVTCGVGCHHAGLLYEERTNIEQAFRNGDLPILITTTTLAMGVNLPAHLVIIKNTQQYVNGAYQEYSISTVLQMVGRAGRPQFDSEATAVIMTRLADKGRYQALVGGCEPLQSYLHKRLAENLNSEAALCTVNDVAQCVQWLRSTFLFVRAARDPKRYLGLPQTAAPHLISKKIEELCVKAMNGLASSGLITMDEASCIESTEAGRLMSIYYLDLETMKHIMKIKGDETLEQLLWIVCESHELSDMHLRVDERRCLNALNRNNSAATIRFPMKGRITTRQMKLNCIIQAVLGCLPIHEPSLNQEALKIMRIADRICKCIVAYVTRPNQIVGSSRNYLAVLNSIVLAKCIESHLWENSVFVSKQLKGIGPTFSTLLATAGKSNFMLLEESHPRDLERIMNKGPPAGNVLRKQIGLLPKYQLTVAPRDDSLSLQLTLLNQTYLAENVEHLTAGVNHKCYIIIGDTENCLLSLTSFKDKDLIGIYDGQITVNVKRKHNFEHKVTAHCISSNFVGIDVHCEYQFNDLNGTSKKDTKASPPKEIKAKGKIIKQAAITDTFKVRKRKNHDPHEISVGKQKREYSVIGKIDPAKTLNDDTNIILKNETNFNQSLQEQQKEIDVINQEEFKADNKENYQDIKNLEFKYNDESDKENNEDDNQINCILKQIEQEIYGQNALGNSSSSEKTKPNKMKHSKIINTYNEFSNKQRKIEKSNFNFIDHIDKQSDVNDKEECVIDNNKNTFVDSVKSYIDVFLEKAKHRVNVGENSLINLVGIKNSEEAECINDKVDDKTEKNGQIVVVEENDVASNVIKEYNNATNTSANNPRSVQYKTLDFEISPKEDNINNDEKVVSLLCDSMDTNDNTSLNPCDIDTVRTMHDVVKSNSQYNPSNLKVVVKENVDKTIRNQNDNYCSSVIQEFNEEKRIISENESNTSLQSNDEHKFISNDPKPIFNSNFNEVKNSDLVNLSDRIKCNINKITCKMEFPLLKTVFEHKPLVQSFTSPINNNNIVQSTSDLEKSAKAVQSRLKSNSNYNTFTEPHDPVHPNICNDLSNIISEETNCTKKVSFTKTQINVFAKNTLEEKYCVMSQLKFDIGITETKTAVKNKYALVEHKQNDHENEINYNLDSIKSLDCSGNSLIPFQLSAVDNQSNNSKTSGNQEVKYKNEMNYNLDPIKSLDCSRNSLIPLQLSAVDNQSNNSRTSGNQEVKYDPEHQKTFAIEENTTEKNSTGQKNRTINDIIEKYKNIMSSKSNVNKQTEYRMEGTIASQAESRQNEKIKRPFKITDLPSLLEPNRELENTQLRTQTPMYFTPEVRKNTKEDDIVVVIEKEKHNGQTSNANHEMFYHTEIEPTELSDETDMSQSMLDPKAVLECLKQDIIPPPAQFCDDYIPTDENNIFDNIPSTSNHRFKTQSNELNNIYKGQSLDNKAFRENEESIQQSSEAVETWSLTNDEHDDPCQLFKIMSNRSKNFRPQLNVRKAKLNEFQFTRKNIFKHRK